MKDTHQKWFKEAKLGLFIHWGLYSHLAGEWKGQRTQHAAEWILNDMNIPVEEYRQIAAEFNPVNFDADALVKRAKEKWGMKYLVFTSKHHDGFAMWHSKVSKYNIVDATPFRRDVMKELSDACAKYGLRFCLYYSQAQDWDDPDGYIARRDNSGKNFDRYMREKCIPQLKEILTGYGKISSIWFDTPMELTPEQSQEILGTVKAIQPECLISGRIGNDLGDYMSTGDNFIPASPYLGDWEVPATLNDTWGYSKFDHNWKSPQELRALLLDINNLGGNYLLNIGPDGMGNIPEESVRILDEFGSYVMKNQDAIFATRAVVDPTYKLDYGIMTSKPYKVFLHVIFRPKKVLRVLGLGNIVNKAYILDTGEELGFSCVSPCSRNHNVSVRLPEEYWDRTGFCVCIETKEDRPVFEKLV